MRSVLMLLVATALVVGAAQPAATQMQTDPFVSCVKCHALPGRTAWAAMGAHGYGAPPTPEQACAACHDTWFHEQNPQAPPVNPFFLMQGGVGSPLTGACLRCHSTMVPAFPDPLQHAGAFNHGNDVFPYFDLTPPSNPPLLSPPTAVLPLFTEWGAPDQMGGGLVCATCHDPHDPSYGVSGHDSFLRIGTAATTEMLCNYCHDSVPPDPPAWTVGYDLFIDSRSDSVRFEKGPNQELLISATVMNRGNGYFTGGPLYVRWVDSSGMNGLYLPGGYLPPLDQHQEASVMVPWMPPPDWDYGEGFFIFELPPRPLLPDSYFPVEFVRAMDVTPPPSNVRVTGVTPGDITLAWDQPVNPPADLAYDIYRDGLKITTGPLPYWQAGYTDWGLAPETPHVYTVVAVRQTGGPASLPSAPAGGTTTRGVTIKVPQQYATIQAAINAAGMGTTVLVAPGTYAEQLTFSGKQGVTVRGQDANGSVLDFTGSPYPTLIDLTPDAGGNTIAGFTIRGAQIFMGAGDVVAESVLVRHPQYSGPLVFGGGLIAHCVFDVPFGPAVEVLPGGFLTSVNSIYLGAQPPFTSGGGDPSQVTALFNNNFPNWWDWYLDGGFGNFGDLPLFLNPGLPQSYLTDPISPTVGRGLSLFSPPYYLPTVGAFEAWEPYTPQPPLDLTAAYDPGTRSIHLDWVPSVNDIPGSPPQMQSYLVFRSESPSFPPATEAGAFDMVPLGMPWYEDANLVPGVTYYYQVRAFNGLSGPSATELLSAPTNTASAAHANNPPDAIDDSLTLPEDMPAVVDVLINDSDPENEPLVVTAVGQPQHGAAQLIGGGLVEYVPVPDFFGADSFSYTVADGAGGVATATVAVTVTPINDAPLAAGDAYSVPEDGALIVAPPGVLGNDSDPDGDTLMAMPMQQPEHGTLFLRPDGSFDYTPAPDFSGTDSFTYHVYDGMLPSAPETVTITISSVNDPPVAVSDAYSTPEDARLSVGAPGVLGNDTDPDGNPLMVMPMQPPAHGALFLRPDGSFDYTPAPDFSGTDSFTYHVFDGMIPSAPATVTITVSPVNDAPLAGDDSYATAEDAALIVIIPGVLGNDADADGDTLRAELLAGPAHGTLALGLLGDFSYTPAANFNGADSFTYRASDGLLASGPATVTITVSPVNDPPLAAAGADQAGTVGQVLSFSGAASSDVDGAIVGYAWSWGDGTPDGSGVAATHAFTAPGTFTVTLTVTDDGGATASDTLVVTVTEVNLALNKAASASSSRKGADYTPAKAVDGSATTSWMSANARAAQWVRVDLGASQLISKVRVLWPETYYATSFRIQYSTNGKQWSGVVPEPLSGNGAPTVVTFPALNARYVRVSCETPNNTAYYGVSELEVYR